MERDGALAGPRGEVVLRWLLLSGLESLILPGAPCLTCSEAVALAHALGTSRGSLLSDGINAEGIKSSPY